MTAELGSTEKALLKVIKRHPAGIRKEALIAASGWTSYHCSGALKRIRASGLAQPTNGSNAVWLTAENMQLLKAERERLIEADKQARAQRAADRVRRAAERAQFLAGRAADAELKHRQLSEEEQAAEDFARPSIHNLVPVGGWERQPINAGPASIFHLTEAA